ncbi:hypothetical protein [Parasitella parasitica]|uniref:Zn(2)-C6 fungal-type domain-containing protein n=1 Tax=Parasitella parasitica TaxID=35722 RepID=A0A0B7NBZ2_9FUNG|nr:hypothetical protein [Parasitella parasitica]
MSTATSTTTTTATTATTTATSTMKKPSSENTRTKSSNKRPRAPIACFRCHHKKVRCDGVHPNCTRCLSTGVLCAYPSSRRSRTTQPTNVDPFIDNLSHLEARIRRIESDLANQRSMVHSIVNSPIPNDELESKMIKTEMEVQDSRSILAQLRLRGEQRISRNKRAAAAAATTASANNAHAPSTSAANNANTAASLSLPITKEEKVKNKQLNTKSTSNRAAPKNSKSPKQAQGHRSNASQTISKSDNSMMGLVEAAAPSSFYFQDMMLGNNTDLACYDSLPPGHGMDWTLFDQNDDAQNAGMHQQAAAAAAATAVMMSSSSSSNLFHPNTATTTLSEHHPMMMFHNQHHHQQQQQDQMMMDKSPLSSTRSSSLASNFGGYPVTLQPSNSTNSVNSNVTALSSTTSCTSISSAACDNIFNFNMDDMLMNHHPAGQQGIWCM